MASDLGGLQPFLQPYARALVALAPGTRVTSTYRSYTEQLRLWNNRSNNPYPVAPPGQSLHQYGLAFDLDAPADTLAFLGEVWNYWGGHWSTADPIHFEVR